MNDICKHCECRGNLSRCLKTRCSQHENWIVTKLLEIIKEAPTYFSHHNFGGDKLAWLKKAQIVKESRPKDVDFSAS